MKVSKAWLKELVDLKVPIEKVEKLLPLRTIATKEITPDFIELDMKGYNRADLLSMRGVAYEISAITDSSITFEEVEPNNFLWLQNQWPELQVDIENQQDTPVYCMVKIENIKVEQSNDTWIKKLSNSGVRNINNVADLTNLIMIEYGQPLHAFDADKVAGNVRVRRAKEAEEIETIDHKKRILSNDDLVIADQEKAIGIAGVMGGADSEISSQTTSILLEAAIFDPKMLRKTANRLKLNSEASKRFYHGLTQIRLFEALDAVIKGYQSLGGKVTALTIQTAKKPVPRLPITLRKEKLDSLIGVSIDEKEVEDYLTRLRFVVEKTPAGWEVTPPYWRTDVEIEVDLIEEVARMYGYENIPAKPLEGEKPEKVDQSLFDTISKVKQSLVKLGLTEVQTYSFYSTAVLAANGFNESNIDILVKVSNPMSAETEYLRMDIWPNLLETISKNPTFDDIAIFEVGKTFKAQKDGPEENFRLSIALKNGSDNPTLELVEIVKQLFKALGKEIKIIEPEKLPDLGVELFHPKRFVYIESEGKVLAGVAEIHKRITDKLGIKNRVSVFEINFTTLQ